MKHTRRNKKPRTQNRRYRCAWGPQCGWCTKIRTRREKRQKAVAGLAQEHPLENQPEGT